MFNVGSEDKEKLRENMEEIKDLIQGRDEASSEGFEPPQETSSPSQDTGFEDSNPGTSNLEAGQDNSVNQVQQDGGSDEFLEETNDEISSGPNTEQNNLQDNQTEDLNTGQDSGNGFQQQQQQNQRQQPVQNQTSNNQRPQQNSIEQSSQAQTGNPLQQSAQQQSSSDNQQRNESQVVNSSGTQNSQRNNSRPGSSGSQKLFLEVERFEKVKDMIDEMQQLTSEIEDTSEDLESQIDKERESENQAQQLLENFSDRKNQVEDVVLDSEEN